MKITITMVESILKDGELFMSIASRGFFETMLYILEFLHKNQLSDEELAFIKMIRDGCEVIVSKKLEIGGWDKLLTSTVNMITVDTSTNTVRCSLTTMATMLIKHAKLQGKIPSFLTLKEMSELLMSILKYLQEQKQYTEMGEFVSSLYDLGGLIQIKTTKTDQLMTMLVKMSVAVEFGDAVRLMLIKFARNIIAEPEVLKFWIRGRHNGFLPLLQDLGSSVFPKGDELLQLHTFALLVKISLQHSFSSQITVVFDLKRFKVQSQLLGKLTQYFSSFKTTNVTFDILRSALADLNKIMLQNSLDELPELPELGETSFPRKLRGKKTLTGRDLSGLTFDEVAREYR